MAKAIMLCMLLCANYAGVLAQRCLTSESYQSIVKSFPQLKMRYGISSARVQPFEAELDTSVIKIHVAVHIVWNTEEEKISVEKVQEQINILNNDFSAANSDLNKVPNDFKGFLAGNTNIQFILDTVTYTKTVKADFKVKIYRGDAVSELNQSIKFTGAGGKDGFSCTKFLNVWVGNIKDGHGNIKVLCGYATYPGGPDKFDGVVINYKCFGKTAIYPQYDRGRTVTHEVGHWLNLKHLWGDNEANNCADDDIEDTPPQKTCHTGCPSYPQIVCDKGAMFMDFMDYVDDECMIMFTKGQRKRMRNCFNDFSQRHALIEDPVLIPFTNKKEAGNYEVKKTNVKSIQVINEKSVFTWSATYKSETYDVLIREVGKRTWETVKNVADNKIEIAGLKPAALYEVVIKTFIADKKIVESAPYIFISKAPKL